MLYKQQTLFVILSLLFIFVLCVMVERYNLSSELVNSSLLSVRGVKNTDQELEDIEEVSDNVMKDSSYRTYGHVHMAKTAGTTLNGKLASDFERVCGNKGYSYDAYQFNKRLNASFSEDGHVKSFVDVDTGDVINRLHEKFNRGRVPFGIMSEIGFEDCEYISLEISYHKWDKVTASLPQSLLPLELHVPCRDSLSHLMSMCNFSRRSFDCNAKDLEQEITECLVQMNRFNKDTFQQNPDIDLKCYPATPIEPYIEYMSHRLQSKRAVYPYFMRDTNKPRDKEKECIWQNEEVLNRTKTLLRDLSYFAWCEECLGSNNDLLA